MHFTSLSASAHLQWSIMSIRVALGDEGAGTRISINFSTLKTIPVPLTLAFRTNCVLCRKNS